MSHELIILVFDERLGQSHNHVELPKFRVSVDAHLTVSGSVILVCEIPLDSKLALLPYFIGVCSQADCDFVILLISIRNRFYLDCGKIVLHHDLTLLTKVSL